MSYQSFYPSYADMGLFSRAEIVLPTTDTGYKSYGPNGRLFLPAATNLIGNPRISSATFMSMNVGSWTGGAPSLTTTSLGARLVATATAESYLDISHSNTSSDYDIARWGVEVGDVVTYTVDVDMQYAGFASMVTSIVFFTAGWASIAEPHTHIENGKSTVSVTATIPATTAYLVPLPLRMTGPAESTVDTTVTKAVLTKASFATPYFDGDSDNCAWTGSANASTSTRAYSLLKFTNGLPPGLNLAGTIAGRMTPLVSGLSYFSRLVSLRKSGTGHLNRVGMSPGGYWTQVYNDVVAIPAQMNLESTAGTTDEIVSRWDSTTLSINVNGEFSSAVNTCVQQAFDQAIVGGDDYEGGGAGLSGCGYNSPVVISPVKKSDAWTAAIQASNWDPALLWRDFMEPGDMLIPLTSDSRAYVKTNGAMGSAYANVFTGADPTTDTGWVSYE